MKESLKRSGEAILIEIEIPMKLPSLNDYVNVCRENRYKAAKFKRELEDTISLFLRRLPVLSKVIIHFHWIEENKRRDYDNVCFAKKFVLDALVKTGKLKDDNRRFVVGFTDSFSYGDKAKVILRIEEIK